MWPVCRSVVVQYLYLSTYNKCFTGLYKNINYLLTILEAVL
jgi:hypothetical protein